ncbi:DNA-directed DNA polymerase gamma mip1, partial [Spiromyces aspiralis]
VKRNEMGIQMLASKLRDAVFPNPCLPLPTKNQLNIAVDHLKSHNIYDKKESELVPPVGFDTPPLLGATINEHFWKLGGQVAEPYLGMAKEFAAAAVPPPPSAKRWVFRSGWTRYTVDDRDEPVLHPPLDEGACSFDIEALVSLGPYPLMASAVTAKAWYGWVSPYLTGESPTYRHLIPLGNGGNGSSPRLVVGHNVGFDRARVEDEYSLRQSPIRYLDTMSLHVAVSGLCNQQRPHWLKYDKALESEDQEYLRLNSDTGKFYDVGAMNSLRVVAKFYCGISLDKTIRDVFFDGTVDDIKCQFNELMAYCAKDSLVTHQVFSKVFPLYLKKCPHPVSFAGMLLMLNAFMPVNTQWPKYIERCEQIWQQISSDVELKLKQLADEAVKLKDRNEYISDPWLRNLDWTIEQVKMTKPKLKKDGTYAKGGEPKPYSNQKLPGYPKWYRDLWQSKLKDIHVTARSRIAPYLLKLKWMGYPIYHSKAHGWMFRAPREEVDRCRASSESSDPGQGSSGNSSDSHGNAPFNNLKEVEFPTDPTDPNYEPIPAAEAGRWAYFKVPHKDGEEANCGNPLAKGYHAAIEKGTLTSAYPIAKQVMAMSMVCSYWISARERIKSQFVVWPNEVAKAGAAGATLDFGMAGCGNGIILPQVVPMGTITRRGVESTWMTASNAKKDRIGSELKSLITAPPGYVFVGADVDSEELWISSLIGDSQFGTHGATALGWMTLQGTKAEGTDMHSVTARILGIDRGSAKVFNYARIYGAGVKFATSVLLQFNPGMDEQTARKKAEALYAATKGRRERNLQYFGHPFWHGGTETYMFNRLEEIATSSDPRTPVLECGITEALKASRSGPRYMTSRVNWVVQSSAVDYLHLLLVSMSYLIHTYRIDARFVISVHDEIRYLVSERDKYRAALALQVSNFWVRSLFSYKLGIEDLPQSVAFFSSVDIDHVLRKEVEMECITPSNPEPISPGISLDILEILQMTQGHLSPSASAAFAPTLYHADAPSPASGRDDHADNGNFTHLLGLKYKAGRPNASTQKSQQSPAIPSGLPITRRPTDLSYLRAQMLYDITEIRQLLFGSKRGQDLPLVVGPANKYKKTSVVMIKRAAKPRKSP